MLWRDMYYRKVASSRPVYYSIFDYFLVATNWDVLLTETCYYYHVHQSIKRWVKKGWHKFISIFANYIIVHRYSHLPWLVFYFCKLYLTKWSKILGLSILIFINKDWEKSDLNSWGSYILLVGKVVWN